MMNNDLNGDYGMPPQMDAQLEQEFMMHQLYPTYNNTPFNAANYQTNSQQGYNNMNSGMGMHQFDTNVQLNNGFEPMPARQIHEYNLHHQHRSLSQTNLLNAYHQQQPQTNIQLHPHHQINTSQHQHQQSYGGGMLQTQSVIKTEPYSGGAYPSRISPGGPANTSYGNMADLLKPSPDDTPVHDILPENLDENFVGDLQLVPGNGPPPQNSYGVYLRIPEQKRLFQSTKDATIVVEICVHPGYPLASRYVLNIQCDSDHKWNRPHQQVIIDRDPPYQQEITWNGVAPSKNKRVELRISISQEGGPPIDTKCLAVGIYSNTNQRKSLMLVVAMFFSGMKQSQIPAQYLNQFEKINRNKTPNTKRVNSKESNEEVIPLSHARYWVNECWKFKFYNKERSGLDFSPPDSMDWSQILLTFKPALTDYLTVSTFNKLIEWAFEAGEEALRVHEMWRRGAIFFCSTAEAERLLCRPELFLIRFSSAGYLNFAFHQPGLQNNQGVIRPQNDDEILYYIDMLVKKGFNIVLKTGAVLGQEFLREWGGNLQFRPRGEGKYGPIATMLSNKLPSTVSSTPSTPYTPPQDSAPSTPSNVINNFSSFLQAKDKTTTQNSAGGPSKRQRDDNWANGEDSEAVRIEVTVRSAKKYYGSILVDRTDMLLVEIKSLIRSELEDVLPEGVPFHFASSKGNRVSNKQEASRTLADTMSDGKVLTIIEDMPQ